MSNGRLYVCSMTKVVDTVRASGARSLVTILTAGASLVRPCEIARDRHLRIAVSDIDAQQEGHILPGEEHIDRLLAFLEEWDQSDPLVIHCYAGRQPLARGRLRRRLRARAPSLRIRARARTAPHLADRDAQPAPRRAGRPAARAAKAAWSPPSPPSAAAPTASRGRPSRSNSPDRDDGETRRAVAVAARRDRPHGGDRRRARRRAADPRRRGQATPAPSRPCPPAPSIRSATALSRSACAPGSPNRPARRSAMSSSSTLSATAAATPAPATATRMWSRSAISR